MRKYFCIYEGERTNTLVTWTDRRGKEIDNPSRQDLYSKFKYFVIKVPNNKRSEKN